jgi:hypothetical protein
MRQDQLKQQRVQRVEPAGPIAGRLCIFGLHGAGEFVRAIQIGDVVLERLPGEETDALRMRAMREVVPNLPVDAWRDSSGNVVGFFRYDGLDPDFCRPTTRHLEGSM